MNFLEKNKITEKEIIGKGNQSTVYAYGKDKVIKVTRNTPLEYVQKLQDFYKKLSKFQLNFKIPEIEEIYLENGVLYIVEGRIEGKDLMKVLETASEENAHTLLVKYFEIIDEFRKTSFNDLEFGEMMTFTHKETRANSWQEFLSKRIKDKFAIGKNYLKRNLKDPEFVLEKYLNEISEFSYNGDKTLVHGDYFPGNIIVNDLGEITHIIDFSEFALIGDYKIDLSSSIFFLGKRNSKKYSQYLIDYAVKKYGEDIKSYFEFYKIYYSFLFCNCEEDDPGLFKWSMKNLRKYESDKK